MSPICHFLSGLALFGLSSLACSVLIKHKGLNFLLPLMVTPSIYLSPKFIAGERFIIFSVLSSIVS